MQEESHILNRESLRMKRKRGVVPRRVWNALVDVVFSGLVTSGVGCRVSRTRNGTVIEVPRRPFGAGGEGYQHPWKLLASYDSGEEEHRLKLAYGRVMATVWKDNGASATTIGAAEVQVTYDAGTGVSGKLVGDAFSASGEGYLVLAAETTYGIWLQVPVAGATELVKPGSSGEYRTVTSYQNSAGASIVADSTNTLPSDAATKSTGGMVPFYLGQVITGEDGTATVKQYLRSDVFVGATLAPTGLVSADVPNDLTTGTDGGLLVIVVSRDDPNDISQGSDGGALYEEPA
jgi:hypothetical protein